MNPNLILRNSGNNVINENLIVNQQTIIEGLGSVYIGSNVILGYNLAIHFYGFHIMIQPRNINSIIRIGDNAIFSNDIAIIANKEINIGDNCLLGDRVTILDSDFHEVNPDTRYRSIGCVKPVNIGNNVWIGSGVTILKGVTIGDNSVIAANSVVSKDVAKDSVFGGNPAVYIKSVYDN